MKLIRHTLGTEIYQDEQGRQFIAQPDGTLLPTCPLPDPGQWWSDGTKEVYLGTRSFAKVYTLDALGIEQPTSPIDAQNRAIITAAPELLAALTNLMEIARAQLDQSATHDGLKNCGAIVAAQYALNKAKGEY